jgi:hypothetical protein
MPERPTTPRRTAGDFALLSQRMETMGESIEELKVMVKELSTSIQALEKRELVCQANVVNRGDSNYGRIEDHEKRLVLLKLWQEETQKVLERVLFSYRIIAFIGSSLGISIIALIWALITGSAEITFK